MAKVKLTKKEADRLMKIKGNSSGSLLSSYYSYVLKKSGESGIRLVEERMKELGYPANLKNLSEASSFRWYPTSLSIFIILIILEILDWDESKAFDLGYDAPLHSIIPKLLIKFISLERGIKEVPNYWQKLFDFGNLQCTKINIKDKYLILRLFGFKKFHLTSYFLMMGYLTKIFEIATRSKNVEVKQLKCLFWNDPYDEFKITW